MLDLGDVVVVGLFVQFQLPFVFGHGRLGLLQFEGEAGGRVTVAGRKIGLDLGFQLCHVLLVHRHLLGNPFDQRPVLFEPLAAFFQLHDGLIVLVLHLRDGIGRPKNVRDLVDLGHESVP